MHVNNIGFQRSECPIPLAPRSGRSGGELRNVPKGSGGKRGGKVPNLNAVALLLREFAVTSDGPDSDLMASSAQDISEVAYVLFDPSHVRRV